VRARSSSNDTSSAGVRAAVPTFNPRPAGSQPRGQVAAAGALRNDAVASKRAMARWSKVRVSLTAKSLFCRKLNAADVYETARVAAKGASAQTSPTAAQRIGELSEQCRRGKCKWTDADFPPSARALYRNGVS
jgi:hypothetical protein